MTAFGASPRTVPPPSPPAVRVAVKSRPSGFLDGAWWPRSRDLPTELPALADALDPLWGRLVRAAVNPMLWPVVPRKVTVHDRVVKIGWFTPELDPHKVLLLSYGTSRMDLLVIPPETGSASAARLMTAACATDGPALTATGLLAAERARHHHHDDAAPDRLRSARKPRTGEDGVRAARPFPTAPGR
ncbi:DUF5994 family protein [Streptomyces sp. NPDC016845]|uniref:DUF5994 family protein n=1 Tax=Streptomyces sp. NPDC016845 TaxID=3364972 RepID=UPI0037B55F21